MGVGPTHALSPQTLKDHYNPPKLSFHSHFFVQTPQKNNEEKKTQQQGLDLEY